MERSLFENLLKPREYSREGDEVTPQEETEAILKILSERTDNLVYCLAIDLVPELASVEKWYPAKWEIRRYLLHLEDEEDLLLAPLEYDEEHKIYEYLDKLPIAVTLVRHYLWALCAGAVTKGEDLVNPNDYTNLISLDDVAKRTGLPNEMAKLALDKTMELFRKSSRLRGQTKIAVSIGSSRTLLRFTLDRNWSEGKKE